ncbi:hypothetical protein GMOD_00006620 [Pyrenophora seminiperda CCB06]|uniref:Uncharacterized protein n=1 Tax=Pyrenophora seminiperda CCB06 TaxID=1302712 RepID=A0A3M7MAT5_9PLEO|nr:hypothetical protein GMOD_00006620 [Pyrenophora seminiperda CCB06]
MTTTSYLSAEYSNCTAIHSVAWCIKSIAYATIANSVCADELPTSGELKLFRMRIESGPNRFTYITPLDNFSNPLEIFLPPPGPYFDEFILDEYFGEHAFDLHTNGKVTQCLACWRPKHVDSHKQCREQCRVCKMEDHKGGICPRIYARAAWWDKRGYTPTRNTCLRPNFKALTYLVKAGILHSISQVVQPIRVNQNHPLVKEFYRGGPQPQYTPGKVTWPILTYGRRQQEGPRQQREQEHRPAVVGISTTYPAPPVPNTIGRLVEIAAERIQDPTEPRHDVTEPDHDAAELPAPKGSAAQEIRTTTPHQSREYLSLKVEEQGREIERLKKQLEDAQAAVADAQATIAEKDAQILELRGATNTTVRKRVRFAVWPDAQDWRGSGQRR